MCDTLPEHQVALITSGCVPFSLEAAGVQRFEDFNFLLQELDVKVELALLAHLRGFMMADSADSDAAVEVEEPVQRQARLDAALPATLFAAADTEDKLYFEEFKIQPV